MLIGFLASYVLRGATSFVEACFCPCSQHSGIVKGATMQDRHMVVIECSTPTFRLVSGLSATSLPRVCLRPWRRGGMQLLAKCGNAHDA